MPEHGHTGDCPECGAPAAGSTCTHCGHRRRPARLYEHGGPAVPADPAEAADLAAAALTAGALRSWYDRQPPGSGQEAHPDAGDVPTLGQQHARAAARRRLDEQTTAARADRW